MIWSTCHFCLTFVACSLKIYIHGVGISNTLWDCKGLPSWSTRIVVEVTLLYQPPAWWSRCQEFSPLPFIFFFFMFWLSTSSHPSLTSSSCSPSTLGHNSWLTCHNRRKFYRPPVVPKDLIGPNHAQKHLYDLQTSFLEKCKR